MTPFAPTPIFSASAACSEGAPWGPGERHYHLRVHTHPCLGVPAAPFLVFPAIGEMGFLGAEQVTVTHAHGEPYGESWSSDADGRATLWLPPGDAYLWLSAPQAGVAFELQMNGGPTVVDLLPATGGGPLASLRPLVRRQARDRSVVQVSASGITLLRVTSPEGVDIVDPRGWLEPQIYVDDGPLVTAFGPPSTPARWYTPIDDSSVLTAQLPNQPQPAGDPEGSAWWRVEVGAPKSTGPGDREPALSVDPSDEHRRVEARLGRRGGADLAQCLATLLDASTHPLDEPPTVSWSATHENPMTGAPLDDRFEIGIADLLALAAADPGVARWLGTLAAIPGAVDDLIPWAYDQFMGSWRLAVVVGLWSMPATRRDPHLQALVGSPFDVVSEPHLMRPFPQAVIGPHPDTGVPPLALACAVAIPGVADREPMPSVMVVAGSARTERAWIESDHDPARWRQRLQFPVHREGEPTTGIPAGARIAIRRVTDAGDEVVTPVIEDAGSADEGRAIPWLPRTDTPDGARFLATDIPGDTGRTWRPWVIDEFGRWSDEPSEVSAEPPPLIDPPPPALQVRFTPATAEEADARDGRGHLWVRGTLAAAHPAGTASVSGIELAVGSVNPGFPPPDTGWVDLGDALPVLAVGASIPITVTATTVSAARPSTQQTVDIVDGRLPVPIPDVPEVRWTSRPSPAGTATLRYMNPSGSHSACVVRLTDEGRLRHHCATVLGLDPPDRDRPRRERADFFWSHRDQFPSSLFSAAGDAAPGAHVDVTVPGSLSDLLLVKVVAHDRNGRAGRWDDAPVFLYAVPDPTVPPPPLVDLEHDGAGLLRVTLRTAPGAVEPNRWQVLTSSAAITDDVHSFARTTKVGDSPQVFELDCPPWVPLRIAARAALAPESLGGPRESDREWSSPTSPRAFTYVPPDPPEAPYLDGSIDGGNASVEIQTPVLNYVGAIAPHRALVTFYDDPPAPGPPVVDEFDIVRHPVIQAPGVGFGNGHWTVAIKDPAGRVGPAATIYVTSLPIVN